MTSSAARLRALFRSARKCAAYGAFRFSAFPFFVLSPPSSDSVFCAPCASWRVTRRRPSTSTSDLNGRAPRPSALSFSALSFSVSRRKCPPPTINLKLSSPGRRRGGSRLFAWNHPILPETHLRFPFVITSVKPTAKVRLIPVWVLPRTLPFS